MNMTHNVKSMAEEAGIEWLWVLSYYPEAVKASSLVPALTHAVELMTRDPDRFRRLDSPNGWGTYANFLPWLQDLLRICTESPGLNVRATG